MIYESLAQLRYWMLQHDVEPERVEIIFRGDDALTLLKIEEALMKSKELGEFVRITPIAGVKFMGLRLTAEKVDGQGA